METETEKELDSNFRSGAAFVAAGFLIIAAIWYVFLRPSEARAELPPTIPLTTASAEATIYELVPESSAVRFTIDELLRGQQFTVLGFSRLVTGQIKIEIRL